MKSSTTSCTECGADLQTAPTGASLCARCLLRLGLNHTSGPLAAGDLFDHYEVLGLLGAGGMGHVYSARDTKLNRKVAIKVLTRSVADDPAHLLRFRREAQTLAALRHPNVVTVYSVEESDGHHYISMELVEGETLDTLVGAHAIELAEFFNLAVDLSRAVAAAHKQGIIHRDLKPSNLMLDSTGVLRVLDFGLAKPWDPASDGITLDTATTDGSLIGTVPYMSPEQLEGREVGTRSDVFSLGIVLYELATGEHPFERDTVPATISSILRDPAPALRQARRELPSRLEKIISRCLEKDPESRYPSATELARDLESLREHPFAFGELEDAPGWTRIFAWDRFWPIAVGVLVVVLLTAALLQRTGNRELEPVEPIDLVAAETGTELGSPLETKEADGPDPREVSPHRVLEQPTEAPVSPKPGRSATPIFTRPESATSIEPSTEDPIASEVTAFTIEAALFRSARNGYDLLVSGSRVRPGDRLFMTLRVSQPVHVYVLNEDDLGKVFVLFPLQVSDLTNPVEAGRNHRLPGPGAGTPLSWQVSSAGGEEHILVIASPEPLAELEALIKEVPEAQPTETLYLEVPDPVIATLRGIGGLVVDESSSDVPSTPRLFTRVRNLVAGPESSRGIWFRRIDLRNPVQAPS